MKLHGEIIQINEIISVSKFDINHKQNVTKNISKFYVSIGNTHNFEIDLLNIPDLVLTSATRIILSLPE